MTKEEILIYELKDKQDKISELEGDIIGLKEKIEVSNNSNSALGDQIRDLKGKLKDKEAEISSLEFRLEVFGEPESDLPNHSIEDQRKIDLLRDNWNALSYDQLYDLLGSVIPNLLILPHNS